MASPSTVLTLGFGSFGSVNLLPTLGYGIGAEVDDSTQREVAMLFTVIDGLVQEIDKDVLAASDLPLSGVTAGTYQTATVTIDKHGRITSATAGPSPDDIVLSFNGRSGAVTFTENDIPTQGAVNNVPPMISMGGSYASDYASIDTNFLALYNTVNALLVELRLLKAITGS